MVQTRERVLFVVSIASTEKLAAVDVENIIIYLNLQI